MYMYYRDIKTTNILIDESGQAKLCDFSFACHLNSESKGHYIYGTDEFMSPEIALSLDFTQAADIFSFGIVLCEVICGKEPSANFLCRRPQESFALNEEELRVSVLSGCPEALEALALLCCEVDPCKRPDAHMCREELQVGVCVCLCMYIYMCVCVYNLMHPHIHTLDS